MSLRNRLLSLRRSYRTDANGSCFDPYTTLIKVLPITNRAPIADEPTLTLYHELTHWTQQVATTYGQFDLALSGAMAEIAGDLVDGVSDVETSYSFVVGRTKGLYNAPIYLGEEGAQLISGFHGPGGMMYPHLMRELYITQAFFREFRIIEDIAPDELATSLATAIPFAQFFSPIRVNDREVSENRSGRSNDIKDSILASLARLPLRSRIPSLDEIMEGAAVTIELRSMAEGDKNQLLLRRFQEVSRHSYSRCLRDLCFRLAIPFTLENVLKHCLTFIAIFETALNPPLPPRYISDTDAFDIGDLHPSIRFVRLMDSMDRFSLSKIDFKNPTTFAHGYWAACAILCRCANLTFAPRVVESNLLNREITNRINLAVHREHVAIKLERNGETTESDKLFSEVEHLHTFDTHEYINYVYDTVYNAAAVGSAGYLGWMLYTAMTGESRNFLEGAVKFMAGDLRFADFQRDKHRYLVYPPAQVTTERIKSMSPWPGTFARSYAISQLYNYYKVEIMTAEGTPTMCSLFDRNDDVPSSEIVVNLTLGRLRKAMLRSRDQEA